jgi:hypothetical protein
MGQGHMLPLWGVEERAFVALTRRCFDPYFVRHPVSASVCCSRRNSAGVFIPSEEWGANVL